MGGERKGLLMAEHLDQNYNGLLWGVVICSLGKLSIHLSSEH